MFIGGNTVIVFAIFPLCFQGLNVVDLEDLVEDIHVYCTIEKDTNLEFWKVPQFPNTLHVVVCVEE